jgi:hypothetical protein
LDDFVTLNLEKLDKFVHLRGTGLDEFEWKGSDDEDGESDSDGEEEEESDEGESGDEVEDLDDEDEEGKARRHAAMTQAEKEALRQSATKFMGVTKDTTRSEEDVISTPLPGETLRLFYDRSRRFFSTPPFDLIDLMREQANIGHKQRTRNLDQGVKRFDAKVSVSRFYRFSRLY